MILAAVPLPRSEDVELIHAAGRVLGRDVVAGEDCWPFARAAMDGIAVRAADVAHAAPGQPAVLRVVGSAYCGDAEAAPLPPGCATRIATGAAIPPGADAVIQQEWLRFDEDRALVDRPVPTGRHVFPAAEDARRGETLLIEGTVLHGGHAALLAALGYDRVPVHRAVRVAVIATGDELVRPDAAQGPGRVRDSNTAAIAVEVALAGGIPIPLGPVPDDPEALAQALRHATTESDLVIACGGASVGERDYIRPVLRALGARMAFEGAPLKPGHPASFGVLSEVPVFALPGTPAACRVAFEVLARPALLAMAGHRRLDRPRLRVRLAQELVVRPGRARYLWARLDGGVPHGPWGVPLHDQDSAVLKSSAQADALLEIGPHQEWLPFGTAVTAYLLDAAHAASPSHATGFHAALAIVGARDAGKTTLIERLIPALAHLGVTVGVVKHHFHQDALDAPGTDTQRAAAAGARVTLLAGHEGAAVRVPTIASDGRYPEDDAAVLRSALALISGVDLVLVEGFSASGLPKVLVRRNGIATDRDAPPGPFVAFVGGEPAPGERPHFQAGDIEVIAAYLARRLLGTSG